MAAPRVINLPAIDKAVRLGEYVRGVRFAIAHPEAEFKHGLTTWWPTTGAEIRRQFRRGLHDRINQRVPYLQRGKEA